MGNTTSPGSFYNKNATVGTQANPPGPAQVPISNNQNNPAPSSFYKGTGGISTALAEANFTVAICIPGANPQSSEWLFGFVFDFVGTFPVNFAASEATARVAATGNPVFSVQQNGTQIGTITFSGKNGAFSLPTQTTFQVGDVLEVVAPATVDPTLAHIVISLVGARVT